MANTPLGTTEIFSTDLSVGRLKKLMVCLRDDGQALELYALVDKRASDTLTPDLVPVAVSDQQADILLRLVRGPQ